MIQVIVIADDFTGACDTALQFVRAGLRAEVRTALPDAPEWDPGISVAVIDAETRGLSPRAASDRASDLFGRVRRLEPALVYKKVDSTLRGNVGPELRAACDALGSPLCLFVPAFPEAGRITVGGYQIVRGALLARSEAGRDPANPVRSSYLPDLLPGVRRETVGRVGLETVSDGPDAVLARIARLRGEGRRVVVSDAAGEDHLETLASAAARLSPVPFLCGSAGLAGHLPAAFGLRAAGPVLQPRPGSGPVLVMAGSPSSVTRTQIARLCDRLRVHLHEASFEALRQCDAESAQRAAEGLAPYFEGTDCDAVVLAAHDIPAVVSSDEGEAALSALGGIVRRLVERTSVSGLVLTGGWTAVHGVAALGAWSAEVCAEVETGVPLCRLNGGPWDGMGVVTKAGGFGDAEALVRGVNCLNSLGKGDQGRGRESLQRQAGWRAAPAGSQNGEDLPLLAITAGDPCGVGPEVIAKALAHEEVHRICRPLVVGDRASVEAALRFAGRPVSVHPVVAPAEGRYRPGTMNLLDPGGVDLSGIRVGEVCPAAGKAAVTFVFRAADLAMAGEVDGIVTAPLNKEAMNLAGFAYAGHTELLTDRTGAAASRMMLAAETFRIVHVTTHIALRDVPKRATTDRILKTLELAHGALLDLEVERPRIAVAGINPHCGEGGMFGDEDERIVAPAVAQARERGWDVTGPLPPDTVFRRAYRGEFDAVLAMYHDQGHVPMKLVAFAEAVNVTLGLPIVRTSVDHGTAFDIAGKGVADETNMLAAIRLAARLAKSRRNRSRR